MVQKRKKTYPVSIVGEASYRKAVKETKEDEYVDLIKEEGNPYCKSGPALRVDNLNGDTIGYIPEDSWLYRAIVVENQPCLAKVDFKGGKPAGIRLVAALGEGEIPTVQYGESLPRSGCLGLIIMGTLLPLLSVYGFLSSPHSSSSMSQ